MPELPTVRVLCVDDNADVATSTCTLLELLGFSSRACFDGPAALECAQVFRPHACLLDLNMPGMDGYELASHLRTMLGDVFLVAISAAHGEEHERRYAASRFDLLLAKPADPHSLVSFLTSPRVRALLTGPNSPASRTSRRHVGVCRSRNPQPAARVWVVPYTFPSVCSARGIARGRGHDHPEPAAAVLHRRADG